MTKVVKAGMPKELGSFGRLEDKTGRRKTGAKWSGTKRGEETGRRRKEKQTHRKSMAIDADREKTVIVKHRDGKENRRK